MTDPGGSPSAYPNTRPKDAATLIVLRHGSDGELRVLMGRRADAHVFMPGAVVFPGGKVEAADTRAPACDTLHPSVEAKLKLATRRSGAASPRALALAAIRETFEEAGILIGKRVTPVRRPGGGPAGASWRAFLEQGVAPTLQPLRLVARAITPPCSVRRFDTRFFAVWADCIAAEVFITDDELNSPAWITFDEARGAALPRITRMVLDVLAERLAGDPHLAPGSPVPLYATRRGKPSVEIL